MMNPLEWKVYFAYRFNLPKNVRLSVVTRYGKLCVILNYPQVPGHYQEAITFRMYSAEQVERLDYLIEEYAAKDAPIALVALNNVRDEIFAKELKRIEKEQESLTFTDQLYRQARMTPRVLAPNPLSILATFW